MLGNKNKWFGLCMIPAKWANQTVQTAPHKIKRWMQSKLNNWQDFYSLIWKEESEKPNNTFEFLVLVWHLLLWFVSYFSFAFVETVLCAKYMALLIVTFWFYTVVTMSIYAHILFQFEQRIYRRIVKTYSFFPKPSEIALSLSLTLFFLSISFSNSIAVWIAASQYFFPIFVRFYVFFKCFSAFSSFSDGDFIGSLSFIYSAYIFCCCFCFVFYFMFSFYISLCSGIHYFRCWHWCWKNVNKPRRAIFQNHRQQHLHRAQMEHQMVNPIRLQKTFKRSFKCSKKRIDHF